MKSGTAKNSKAAGIPLPPAPSTSARSHERSIGGTLTDQQVQSLRRAGERLSAELHRLFETLLPRAHTVRGVADALGIDRNIAQRALAAAQPPVDGLEVLIRTPGTRSLRIVVERTRKLRGGKMLALALDAAVSETEQLTRAIAGHQSRLRAMIREHSDSVQFERTAGQSAPVLAARVQAFAGAVEVARSQCELDLGIRIHRPTPEDPSVNQCASIRGMIGYRMKPGGMPCTLQAMKVTGRTPETVGVSDGSCEGMVKQTGANTASQSRFESAYAEVLQEYSTSDLPITKVRPARKWRGIGTDGGEAETHVIEPSAVINTGSGIDVVTARLHVGMPSPLAPVDLELTHMSHVTIPAKRLLLDVYLHRDLASKASAYFAGYLWTPRVEQDIQSAWFDRLPGTPPLAILGRGIDGADTEAWDRQGELTRDVFARLGWDPDDFIGFRGDVFYPVWGARYVTVFGFDSVG